MTFELKAFLIAGCISVLAGLDRMAAMQTMLARPIVAAPLTGFVLGIPELGLQIGALLELLWLGRLPVGASIPPDDTQIAVTATVLTYFGAGLAEAETLVLLALLVSIPLGKFGELFDRGARHLNLRLSNRAIALCEAGEGQRAEKQHLWGLMHSGLASLGTYNLIFWPGYLLLLSLGAYAAEFVDPVKNWLFLLFPLVGAGCILASINVRRSSSMFFASFVSVSLLLWLI